MHLLQATEADLRTAAHQLSPGDLKEFHCVEGGRDLTEVLTQSLNSTTHSIKEDDQLLAVGGHVPSIWFVTTRVLATLRLAQRLRFYRILKQHLAHVRDQKDPDIPLTNYVSVDNHNHIRLLTQLGAVFSKVPGLSPAGHLFIQFWL